MQICLFVLNYTFFDYLNYGKIEGRESKSSSITNGARVFPQIGHFLTDFSTIFEDLNDAKI